MKRTGIVCNKNRHVAYDCFFFLGDRPCRWHKQENLTCKCEHYRRVAGDILIIKLDAMGDVLRTTCLLPLIHNAWPESRVIWITRSESVPLLENNPYVSEVLPYGPDAVVHLGVRIFDRVINLDAGKISSGMASMAKTEERIGYVLHGDGYVVGTNSAADGWLRMGIFDDLKRENRRSYQKIMCSILDLPPDGLKYVLELTDHEKEEGRNHLLNLGLDLNRTIVGIHTGGGGRWILKQWREKGFISLVAELNRELGNDTQILLLGGPLEKEMNSGITKKVNFHVFDAGCDNEVRRFAALIRCCSVVLSGDSLAMHVALSMGRRVVVLFGPTSHTEIELFGLGEKVIPDLDCLSCYKRECDFVPNCMESISVDMVKRAVLMQLRLLSEESK